MHGMAEAEHLSYEEIDYRSDRTDNVGSSRSKSEVSLSCKFSLFEGGSSGSEAADGATVHREYSPIPVQTSLIAI